MLMVINRNHIQFPEESGLECIGMGTTFPVFSSLEDYRKLWDDKTKEGADFRALYRRLKEDDRPKLILYSSDKSEYVATYFLPKMFPGRVFIMHSLHHDPTKRKYYSKTPEEELNSWKEDRWREQSFDPLYMHFIKP